MESLGYNRAFYNESFFEWHFLINHNLIYLANNVIFFSNRISFAHCLKKRVITLVNCTFISLITQGENTREREWDTWKEKRKDALSKKGNRRPKGQSIAGRLIGIHRLDESILQGKQKLASWRNAAAWSETYRLNQCCKLTKSHRLHYCC